MKNDFSETIVYHGSNEIVEHIDLSKSRVRLDFGRGFYATSSYEQAAKWSELKWGRSKSSIKRKVVSKYSIKNDDGLNIKKFLSADSEWLEFVVKNRSGAISHDFDIVIGYIADDRTLLVVNAYMSGLYGVGKDAVDMAISLLKPELLEDQYAFCTEKAVSRLTFEGCDIW